MYRSSIFVKCENVLFSSIVKDVPCRNCEPTYRIKRAAGLVFSHPWVHLVDVHSDKTLHEGLAEQYEVGSVDHAEVHVENREVGCCGDQMYLGSK